MNLHCIILNFYFLFTVIDKSKIQLIKNEKQIIKKKISDA
jgi:hypothetical protein